MLVRTASVLALALALQPPAAARAQDAQPPAPPSPTDAAIAPEPRYSPLPDWVVDRAIPAPDAVTQAPIQAMLLDTQTRFLSDGRESFVRSVIRVASPPGLAAATLTVPWQPDRQMLDIHQALLIRGGDSIDLLAGGRRFTVVRREGGLEQASVTGILTAFLQPEGVQVGDMLKLAFTIRDRPSSIALKPDLLFAVPPGMEVGAVAVRALWPQDSAMTLQGRGLFADVRPATTRGMRELSAVLVAPKQAAPPGGAPPRFALNNRVQLSPYRDWSELATLFGPLFRDAAVLPPGSSLAAQADLIAQAEADPRRRLIAALALVQDQVRYVADTLEERNYRPLGAEQSWVQRLGDCKAKTVMLMALLGRLGIEAEPVLVNSQLGDLAPELLPTPLAFDHVIVRARIGEDIYWLDGTRMGDRDLSMLRTFEFRSGLPLIAGGTLETPAAVPFSRSINHWEVAVDASAGLGAAAPTTGRAIFYGTAAQRWAVSLASLAADDLDKSLKSFWTSLRSTFDVQEARYEHDPATGETVLYASGTSRLGWRRQGDRRLPALALDRSVAQWTPPFATAEEGRADAPYALFFPNHLSSRETVTLPAGGEGFEIDADPIDETVGGVEISRLVRREGAVVTATSRFRPIRAELPESSAARARERIEELNARPALIYAAAYRPGQAERDAMAAALPDVAQLLTEGRAALHAGRIGDALETFRTAVGSSPTTADAWALRGLSHFWNGEFEDASADFDRTSSIDPNNVVASNGRALLAAYRGRTDDALAALDRSAELEPGDNWVKRKTVDFARIAGDWPRALAELDELAAGQETEAAGWRARRAQLLAESGERADALALAAEMAGSDATLDELMSAHATYLAVGDVRAQRRTADRVRSALAANQAMTAGERAATLEAIGDLDAAAKYYDLALAAESDSAALYNSRCWFRATWNRELEGALADCERGLALQPGSAALLDSRALVLLRLGRAEEAVAGFDAALAERPMLAAALYGRGLARAGLGQMDASRRDLLGARSLFPDIVTQYARWGLTAPADLLDPRQDD